jgi:predicted enzyme related to lactoylglutathione lyase
MNWFSVSKQQNKLKIKRITLLVCYISDKRSVGNNTIPVFWSDDVDATFKKIRKQGIEIVNPPENLAFTDYPYYCFQCKDTEGNIIEIAKYECK